MPGSIGSGTSARTTGFAGTVVRGAGDVVQPAQAAITKTTNAKRII